MSAALALLAGLTFALGLGLSGMTDPAKVRAFLDFSADWDPRLAAVMVSAIAVHATLRALTLARRSAPLFGRFEKIQDAPLDANLIVGAAIFGIGWGVSGYCPGPAWVSLFHGARPAMLFMLGLLAGIQLFRLSQLFKREAPVPEERTSC